MKFADEIEMLAEIARLNDIIRRYDCDIARRGMGIVLCNSNHVIERPTFPIKDGACHGELECQVTKLERIVCEHIRQTARFFKHAGGVAGEPFSGACGGSGIPGPSTDNTVKRPSAPDTGKPTADAGSSPAMHPPNIGVSVASSDPLSDRCDAAQRHPQSVSNSPAPLTEAPTADQSQSAVACGAGYVTALRGAERGERWTRSVFVDGCTLHVTKTGPQISMHDQKYFPVIDDDRAATDWVRVGE